MRRDNNCPDVVLHRDLIERFPLGPERGPGRESGADADARWPNTVSPWQCYCGAVWRLEEASDDEDKATMRRDEGARSSWSFADETFTDRFEARSRKLTRTVLVQGPVTYLRKRAQPRFQPLAEGMWGALVTTGEPASG